MTARCCEQTIRDLAAEYPRISSVAIVPLGLTRYNTDSRLTAVTPEFCRQDNRAGQQITTRVAKATGNNFAFLGDEIYLRAGAPVPSRAHYGDLPQIEDGVGMVRSFNNGFASLVKRATRQSLPAAEKLNGYDFHRNAFRSRAGKDDRRFQRALRHTFEGRGVANNYFGGDVSVAGLLTGGDFVSAKQRISGDFAIIPKTTLKSDEDIMLDGMKLAELTGKLGVPVYPLDLKSFSQFVFQKN